MPSRSARSLPILVFAGALVAVVPSPAGGTDGEPLHREQPRDRPSGVTRAETARAQAATVVRGNFVSIQVNVDANGNNLVGDAANEPSMAIDPTDPNNLVVGWRQFDSILSDFRQAGYAYSHDGGATWTFPGVLQPGQFRSDPVLAADSDGTFYYYSLSSGTSAEMFISTTKGVGWVGPFSGFGGDKEWMTVDTTGGPGDGNVYTLWNSQFTCCLAGTDFTRSIDGGFAYEGPYVMPVKVKWGTLDVGPDGQLYVVGANLVATGTPAHYVQRSTNAFNTAQVPSFDYTTSIDLGGNTATGNAPNPGGLLGQVWIKADRSAGPNAGNVYVLASVNPPGTDPLDVMFIRSVDGGVTWSAPVRVNDDPVGLVFQWFGAMSVAPDGRIDVTWYDTRSDPSAILSEVYYAYSTDAGSTWSTGLPVSPPFNSTLGYPQQNKIGDYTQMISDDLGAALAYAATFNGEQDVWFVRVGDCNANGVHDSQDISSHSSDDCNDNGIPDECDDTIFEICDDGLENDCDGLVDCVDPDCLGDPACTCDFDGTCELGEDCSSCPTDCPTAFQGCGDGVCETGAGENCLNCPADCNGDQEGDPGAQFCCSKTGGVNPVGCLDPRCNADGFVCVLTFAPACCGDLTCGFAETPCSCELDCGPVQTVEEACDDAIDNDCDGVIDCPDPDCSGAATVPPVGVPSLTVARAELDVGLFWAPLPAAIAYDVVEGDLAVLHASAGDFTAATAGCLVNDLTGTGTTASWFGDDAWYLVRPSFCTNAGSYDVGGPAQAASRDASVAASGADCP